MDDDISLSKKKRIKGTRSMLRGKLLQVLFASEISGEPPETLFDRIFFREYTFDEEEPAGDKLLTKEEIAELEADVPILWKDADIEFARKLLQFTLQTKLFAIESIKNIIENWEFERITYVDRIILEMAIAELLHFPENSPKVVINEAIEIAKEYSTEKSGIFVNGVLDTIYKKLLQEGIIKAKEADENGET
ncbi:MAG: transcription antitermination factor NusB [Ignavibacteria bacterium]|nr:transcription antitermination factor NusB [Ignavibacteria bacterium]